MVGKTSVLVQKIGTSFGGLHKLHGFQLMVKELSHGRRVGRSGFGSNGLLSTGFGGFLGRGEGIENDNVFLLTHDCVTYLVNNFVYNIILILISSSHCILFSNCSYL